MICLPIAKSNWPEGRIGRAKWQDAYLIQKMGVKLVQNNIVDKVLILSGFNVKNVKKSELECMIEACKSLGLSDDKMFIKSFGHDTFSVLTYTINKAKEENTDLMIISSQFHYPRIRWMTWRMNKNRIIIKHKMVIGIPRVKEMFSDIALIFLYPIIDLLGYSGRFQAFTKRRRDSGVI